MRGRSSLSAIALAIIVLASLSAWPVDAGRRAGAYVVTFRELPAERASYAGEHVAGENQDVRFLVVHAQDADAFERRARHDANVLFLEPDAEIYHALLTPNDPYYSSYQYDLQPGTTNISSAWDTSRGSTAVKVCVVDTGQYRSHRDFEGVTWADWKDFVKGKSTPYDDNGHGTHVTGTIGAVLDNGRGVAGIAQASLAGAKVLSRTGSGTVSAVANGITWCANVGAHVINLSLGGGNSSTIASAVAYAHSLGVLVVASAGNSGPCADCVGYPAALAEAYAVACTDASNLQCSFSSQGPQVDIAAPGLNILSTYPAGAAPCRRSETNCYVFASGTSMSAPHVAGLAALVKAVHPDWTGGQVRARIDATAVDLGAPGGDHAFGAGLIQGGAAVAAV